MDCFDRISTTQAELKGQRLIIFFDELNTPLEREPAYGSFLAPLEEGVYVRRGKSFLIAPAFWLFASTEFSEEDPKAPDFLSRLTQGVLSLCVPEVESEGEFEELERVYLGAALLKKRFHEVESVSQDVLDLFRRLPKELSLRKIAELARNFQNVRHRRVVSANIPWRWLETNVRFRKARWEDDWLHRESIDVVLEP